MARATRYRVAIRCGAAFLSRYYTNDYDDAQRVFLAWKKHVRKTPKGPLYYRKNNQKIFVDIDDLELTTVS